MTTETKTGTEISELKSDAKLAEVIAVLNKVITIVNTKRDRGPASQREMTEADAIKVISGSLKDEKHGKAALALGLSYGQVYSARKGFTFKTVGKK
jgi:hypothetical protein